MTITILLMLAGTDALALNKSRSTQKASRTSVKKRTTQKAKRKPVRRSKKRARRTTAKRSPRVNTIKVPTERVVEIQNALIKAGYISGTPSGEYDNSTVEAMKQFQSDNGLDKTGRPSAHSLKKLGVTKRANDGYAVPVKKAEIEENKDADKNL